jgi:integrase/recombinase XerD
MSQQEENPRNNPQYIECPDEYKDVWYEFSEYVNEKYDKNRTINRRKQTSRYWFAWCAENDVEPFTDDDRTIQQYVNDHLDLSDQALSARVSGISMLHSWAYDEGIIDHQVFIEYSVKDDIDGVDPSRTQKKYNEGQEGPDANYHYTTKEDIEKMLENVPSPEIRNQTIIKCFWQEGMRSEELARLEWSNVYPDENYMDIRSSKKDPDDENYWRKVFFNDDLAYYLKRWWNKKRHTIGPHHQESDYVFLTHQKPQMRPSHMSRIVKQSAENAGIQKSIGEDSNGNKRWKYTAHAIRHGHAHHVCNYTETPLNIVAKQLGHEVDTLVNTYVQGDDEAHENWYLKRDNGPNSIL